MFSFLNVFSADDGFSMISPNYFGEKNNVYKDIHYLDNEFLSFMFCPSDEISDLKFYLECGNGDVVNLDIFDTGDENKDCYFTNKNLFDVNCSDFKLVVDYNQNNKIKKIFRNFIEQKQSKLINYVLNKNYEDLEDLDLSYFLIVQNDVEGLSSKLSDDIYDTLKNDRDNDDKCWPAGNCDLSNTIKILNNLDVAGYNLKSRLIEDGGNYIEKNILTNYDGGSANAESVISDFTIEINHSFSSGEEIKCKLTIDNDETRNYIFDDDSDSRDLLIEKNFEEIIDFDCDNDFDDFELNILNDNVLIYNKMFSDENSFKYKAKGKNEFDFLIDIENDFSSTEEINCTLEIDENGEIYNYVFDSDTNSNDLVIEKSAENKIDFECDSTLDNINFELDNVFGNKEIDEIYENKDSFVYNIPNDFSLYACIGEYGKCSYYNTIDSMLVYDSNIDFSKLLGSYIDDQTEESGSEKYVNVVDKVIDSSKYLMYKKDDEIKDYLKFNQNNDGSWGDGSFISRIDNTAFAILGLQNVEADSEYVLDAKKWIYYNEPSNGWGSIENNVYAYLAIKEQIKPYLKIDVINEINTGENLISLENPTIYNLRDLEVSFSPEINSYLSYIQDLGELKGEEKLNFNVNLSDTFFGKLSGEMSITGIDGKGNKLELLKIPVVIVGPTPFNFVENDKFMFVDDNPIVKIDLENNIDSFSTSCSYVNPFDGLSSEVVLTQDKTSIDLLNIELKQGNFNFDLVCKFGTLEFKKSMVMNVVMAKKTFNISTTQISLNNVEDFSITLKSLLKDRQIVNIEFIGSNNDIISVAESSKIIAGNDTRELFFTISDPVLFKALNGTDVGEILITSESGYSKRIPVFSNTGVEVEETNPFKIYYLSAGIFLGIVFVIFLIRRYRYLHSQEEHSLENGEDEYFDDMEFK